MMVKYVFALQKVEQVEGYATEGLSFLCNRQEQIRQFIDIVYELCTVVHIIRQNNNSPCFRYYY